MFQLQVTVTAYRLDYSLYPNANRFRSGSGLPTRCPMHHPIFIGSYRIP